MTVTIPLDQMTTTEKLLAMENIWDDLCRRADEISSPSWHGKVLQQREERVKKGVEEFIDWESAKGRIRESVLSFTV
ncbi:MAG: addiction module protein [Candidatus Desantisbacteria bacterium]